MNTAEIIQLLVVHRAKLMGAWFLFYPGESWSIFQPEPSVVEEPLCRFPRDWWNRQ